MKPITRVLWVASLLGCSFGCSSAERSSDAAVHSSESQDPAVQSAIRPATDIAPPTETCADNPLLAGCSSAAAGIPAPARAAAPAQNSATPALAPPAPGDRYSAPGTNPFVMVVHDPLSTFAVDVDTASYDIFRRDAQSGSLPAPDSVRVEEYVNYFAYDYPQREYDAEVPFQIDLAAAPSLYGAQRTLLRVGLQGKKAPPPSLKKPTNLVFLVDVSGSMSSPDRLPLAQQVATQTLDLLEPTDTVSLVTYASGTAVRLAPTPASERATIVQAIQGLSAGGSTAGASGLDLAYQEAEAGFIPQGLNHIILCTDGDFNVGPSSTAELLDLIRQRRQSGVTFTALGFGAGNLNDAMLEAISDAGNGFYGVISSEDQAARYVDERMLSTLSLIARDMKVQVEFNPELVSAYRLIGYEDRAIADQDFRNDKVDAGEIGAGHRVTALYELVLSGATLPQASGAPPAETGEPFAGEREVSGSDLVQVKIRYKGVNATDADPALEVSASLSPAAIAASVEGADPDLAWAISVASFAELLKRSPYADGAALDTIARVFESQRDRDADRQEFYGLFKSARALLGLPRAL
jgi:Ca-activated chloride channel family protein